MNILLDAYFDRNYGDDIFVKGITSLFPMHKFYAFLEFYPESIIKWANDIPNLFLLPESEIFFDKCFFDAYVCVGGDIFPDGADYTKRIQYIKTVKSIHGKVLFIGFNMFHSYSEKSTLDLCEMMNEADFIAPRDEDSVLILKKMLPDKTIESMADLAFSTELKNLDSNLTGSKTNRILGISVRRRRRRILLRLQCVRTGPYGPEAGSYRSRCSRAYRTGSGRYARIRGQNAHKGTFDIPKSRQRVKNSVCEWYI